MFDIVITGGMVIDGTGTPAWHGDIGIKADTITALGDLQGAVAGEVVSAHGLYVCPGFIDTHAHSDFNLLVDPPGRSKVMQGVTTEVCGNCGMSASPLFGPVRKQRSSMLADRGIEITWSTLTEFSEILEHRGLLGNMLPLIGHGNIRGSVIGYENRPSSVGERAKMSELFQKELATGAWGISTGLMYAPGMFACEDELIELCRIASHYKGIYTTHLRSEGEQVLEALAEAIAIGRQAELPVEISHLKTFGRQNWHKLPDMFRLIELAREQGVCISADRYPYTAASTDLDTVLPAWVCEGGASAELARLKNPTIRDQIAETLRCSERDFADEILIARVGSEKNRELEGRRLGEAAQIRRQAVTDTLLDLLLEEDLQIDAIFFSMSEENLREILKKDYVMIGSDASVWDNDGILGRGKPHPRAFGTFPRVLGKYVRDEHILRLEEAVRKMTGQVAETFGIPDRGIIREGWKADMVLFDLATIRDIATYDNPHQFPDGIVRVMVNGQWVVRDGVLTAARPGRVLKKA